MAGGKETPRQKMIGLMYLVLLALLALQVSSAIINKFLYGIIEVVNIFDDLLEAKNGGSDLDYIEFNLKTYDPRRF